MAIKQSDYFNLDSNIDGFYVDENGVVKIVDNMIGVIGATDGPAAYPTSVAKGAGFTTEEIKQIEETGSFVQAIKNIDGHGLVYDKQGRYLGHKGELFFRDGTGNFSTLKRLSGRTNLISQQGGETKLRDYSLVQNGYTVPSGINLDELMRLASLRSTTFSKGNILQLARNYALNNTTVQIPTVSLAVDAVVWVVARVTVRGSGTITLRHVESGKVLDTAAYNHPRSFTMPCYISWIGSLFYEIDETTPDSCRNTVWDFNSKTFKRIYNPSSETLLPHTLSLETSDGNIFQYAYINVMCMEPRIRQVADIISGEDVISSETTYRVSFDKDMNDTDYSIHINLESSLQTWYTEKSVIGFTINIEREYEGKVFWTVVRNT
jgi:hypothetical protein